MLGILNQFFMKSLFKRALMGVTLGSVLLLASCSAAVRNQEAATTAFFDLLATDLAAAYESTAPEFKEVSTQEDLQAFVDLYPETLDVANINITGFEVEDNYTELYGTITYGTGANESLSVYLYKAEAWQVGGFEMGN